MLLGFLYHYTVTPIDRIASATFALRGQHFNLPQLRDNLFCLVSLLGIFSPPSGSKPYFREDHFQEGQTTGLHLPF